jgi:predicted RNA-binding Zn ribbon-like protein
MKETQSDAPSSTSSVERPEPGGRAPAPGNLAIVQRFVNTWNHEFPVEQDQLRDTRTANTWLRGNPLAGDSRRRDVTVAELDALRELREAIRALAVANLTGTVKPDALRAINTAAAAAPVEFTIGDDGGLAINTRSPDATYVVGSLLAIIHDAQVAGTWSRLKGCRQCGWAFYDSSKNRSAAWCSMSICGNRAKNRTYYQRQRNRR